VKKVPKSSKGLWAIRVQLPSERPPELASAVEAVLEPLGVALSSFEGAAGKGWSVEVLCEQRPRASLVRSALKAIGAPPAAIAYVPPKNWVAETQRLLAPLRIGRFFIHGAHFRGRPPRGAIPLLIDASIAFGTGRHETTRGCLLALDRLARGGRRIKRPLDLGCGSGILALAVAHLWNAPVLAVDTDLNSVAVARENLRINRAAERVRVVRSHGFGAAAVRRAAPFDLIVANILAGQTWTTFYDVDSFPDTIDFACLGVVRENRCPRYARPQVFDRGRSKGCECRCWRVNVRSVVE
jgi:ribosomal protein L11 methyltransferase